MKTAMYNSILIPVDLAHLDEGQKTLKIALSVSAGETEITLLYVIEDIPNWTDMDLPPNFREESIKAGHKELESIAASTERNIKIDVQNGHAYSTILKEAEMLDIDLIVMLSHKPGLKEFFIGSNTSKVVSHAVCSVLVVR